MRRTRQRNECPSPPGSCSHPTICESHGCAALEVLHKRRTIADAALKAAQYHYVTEDKWQTAQPDPMAVTGKLRWEGEYLFLGAVRCGFVREWVDRPGTWNAILLLRDQTCNTAHASEAAARDALVAAVREAIGS